MSKRTILPWGRIAYVLVVFALAFGSGHFVQTREPKAPEETQAPPLVAEAPQPDIGRPLAFSCNREATAEAGVAGMLRILLTDGCAPGTRVTVAQGLLIADWLLDHDGQRHLSFTPLQAGAPLTVTWWDGSQTDLSLPSTIGPLPSRAALAWQGPQFLSIVAQEFGPPIGGMGSGAPMTHSASQAAISQETGGFLTTLGDGIGRTAQVYTFPDDVDVSDVIRLSVAAPVTLRSCARQASATALQRSPLGGMLTSRVGVALPECDAIGQTIILQNVFRDLRLAAR